MTVAAFDLASTTGWAVARPPYLVTPLPLERALGRDAPAHLYGHQTIRNDHDLGRFYLRWEIWFRAFFEEHRPDLVAYEATFSNHNQQATRVTMGLEAVLRRMCTGKKIPWVRTYSNSQIKARATGNGGAPKEEVMAAARAVGWDILVSDEADALWLLDLTLAHLPPELKGVGHDSSTASAAHRGTEGTRRSALV